MYFFNLCATILIIGQFSILAKAEEIKIKVNGLKNKMGNIELALYEQDSFPSDDKAKLKLSVPLVDFNNEARFKNISPGTYAVIVYHDENLNQQLDKNMFHVPTEGYGISLNPKVFGPPQFSKSSFELKSKETKELSIDLNY